MAREDGEMNAAMWSSFFEKVAVTLVGSTMGKLFHGVGAIDPKTVAKEVVHGARASATPVAKAIPALPSKATPTKARVPRPDLFAPKKDAIDFSGGMKQNPAWGTTEAHRNFDLSSRFGL